MLLYRLCPSSVCTPYRRLLLFDISFLLSFQISREEASQQNEMFSKELERITEMDREREDIMTSTVKDLKVCRREKE